MFALINLFRKPWFPHISPDGKWIVMISFPTDIEPNSHPSYKEVMLRLMPASGGATRVIAHLYGRQGTMNVNSWSPDSKHIAFVSNSEKKMIHVSFYFTSSYQEIRARKAFLLIADSWRLLSK